MDPILQTAICIQGFLLRQVLEDAELFLDVDA